MLKILAAVGSGTLLLIAFVVAYYLGVIGQHGRPLWTEMSNGERVLTVALFALVLGCSAFLSHLADRLSEP